MHNQLFAKESNAITRLGVRIIFCDKNMEKFLNSLLILLSSLVVSILHCITILFDHAVVVEIGYT